MGRLMNPYPLLMATGLCLASSGVLPGQSPFDPALVPEAFLIRDHVEVFTDRSLYVAGETIRFRADHRVEGVTEGKPWSTVLYVELITSDGSAVSRGKFSLASGMGSGQLKIPAGAVTGNYYLKSYTRWMRNSGAFSYSYVPLKLINPFKSEVLGQPGQNLPAQAWGRREFTGGSLQCSLPGSAYARGEAVTLSVAGGEGIPGGLIRCCVTVVPEGGIELDLGQLAFPGSPVDPREYEVNYLPDLKGVSLSGSLVRSGEVDHPVPSARIFFALLGETPDYFATVTNDQGRFLVSSPRGKGVQELFIAPDPAIVGQVEVRIDQEFDSENPVLPEEKFLLTPRERDVATEMALRSQLAAVYQPGSAAGMVTEEQTGTDSTLFYGNPGFSLLLDDFVTLPTLEEVFINLVPDVIVETRRGVSTLRLNSPNHSIGLYPPLIMIDHIPVFDHQKVLGINPEKILMIELVNEVYVKGDVIHGGIISIRSRNGDMAGIDLPEGSYFFDFQSVQGTAPTREPHFSPGDRVPDTRNTLLWVEDLPLKPGSSRELTFRAPATPGEYVILVRGLVHQGHVVSASAHFTVE